MSNDGAEYPYYIDTKCNYYAGLWGRKELTRKGRGIGREIGL